MTDKYLILFHMNGCRHCIEILEPKGSSIWDNIKTAIDGMNKNIKIIEIERSEKDDLLWNRYINKTAKTKINELLTGYPSLFIVSGNNVEPYDNHKHITVKSVTEFIKKNVLSNKSPFKRGGSKTKITKRNISKFTKRKKNKTKCNKNNL